MKKEKKINIIIILLGVIILSLAILLILIFAGKIGFKSGVISNDIDYKELAKIGNGDYNFVNRDSDNNNSVIVLSNGKILVNFDYYIENITNGKDVILFNEPSDGSILYILTIDGNVYKYNLTDATSKKFSAEKVDKYKNITRILRYETRKGNAGGCDYIILVDENGKYYSLDSYCV